MYCTSMTIAQIDRTAYSTVLYFLFCITVLVQSIAEEPDSNSFFTCKYLYSKSTVQVCECDFSLLEGRQ